MEWNEILDLLKEVFRCFFKHCPPMTIEYSGVEVYDTEAEKYKLVIKNSDISESELNCIEPIVEKRKLKYLTTTYKSEKVLVIYTPRKD